MGVTVQRSSSPGRPTFEGEQRSPAVRLFGLFNRRWVRAVAILLVVLLVVGTAYSKFVFEPQLTATRLTLWIAGEDERVAIEVDRDDGVIKLVGGERDVSELIVAGTSLFVRASEVGVDSMRAAWVEVPLSAIDPRYSAFLPDRLMSAIDRAVKDCGRPSADAATILNFVFGVDDVSAEDRSLCESAVGAVADVGRDFLVEHRQVRPSDAIDSQTMAVAVGSLDDPTVVFDTLARLLAEPS